MNPAYVIAQIFFVVAAAIPFAANCAGASPRTAGKRPVWLEGVAPQYPGHIFIMGVGTGAAPAGAADAARAEIAKVFKARVRQQALDTQVFRQERTGSGNLASLVQQYAQVTDTTVDETLSAVEIGDRFIDRSFSPPVFYAVAVLDKRKSARTLADKIEVLDMEVARLVERSRSATEPLARVRALAAAVEKQTKRDALNEELRVVHPTGQGEEVRFTAGDLSQQLADALKADLPITLSVSGAHAGAVRHAIAEGLTRRGFLLGLHRSESAVLVEGAVDLSPAEIQGNGWRFFRWSVNFMLSEPSTGTSFGSIVANGREGHLTEEEAEGRALRKMQAELSDRIGHEIAAYIFGRQRSRK